jgi:hypothetical protein
MKTLITFVNDYCNTITNSINKCFLFYPKFFYFSFVMGFYIMINLILNPHFGIVYADSGLGNSTYFVEYFEAHIKATHPEYLEKYIEYLEIKYPGVKAPTPLTKPEPVPAAVEEPIVLKAFKIPVVNTFSLLGTPGEATNLAKYAIYPYNLASQHCINFNTEFPFPITDFPFPYLIDLALDPEKKSDICASYQRTFLSTYIPAKDPIVKLCGPLVPPVGHPIYLSDDIFTIGSILFSAGIETRNPVYFHGFALLTANAALTINSAVDFPELYNKAFLYMTTQCKEVT